MAKLINEQKKAKEKAKAKAKQQAKSPSKTPQGAKAKPRKRH